jgi:hypothetical protein
LTKAGEVFDKLPFSKCGLMEGINLRDIPSMGMRIPSRRVEERCIGLVESEQHFGQEWVLASGQYALIDVQSGFRQASIFGKLIAVLAEHG